MNKQWVKNELNSGWLQEGVKCPRCGSRILYNGNYFCENWTSEVTKQGDDYECDWALPHPVTDPKDKEITAALGISDHDHFA